ncbi:MAG: flagellar hook-associated protein FlgK [Aquificae bacterium]|nr:flagellar hook-associated protein FlgK [Aquificota bacterium]
MSLFTSLSIANQALLANKDAINVVNKNLSNAFTEGYKRRNPIMTNFPTGDIALDKIERAYDQRLFNRFILVQNEASGLENYKDVLEEVESIFNDIEGTGFSNEIDQFFKALNDVAANPDDLVARDSVLSAAQQLVGRIRNSYEALQSTKDRLNETIKRNTDRINDILKNLAEINKDIATSKFNDERKNTYMDERDRLINELSKYIDIKLAFNDNDTINITTVKGIPLVSSDKAEKVIFQRDENNNPVIKVRGLDITTLLKNGKIGGYIQAVDFINQTVNNLNDFTTIFALTVNKVHSQGYNLNGDTNINFFTIDSSSSKTNLDASNIVLAIQKPEELAAATDPTVLNGDNLNVKKLISLKNNITDILSSTEETSLVSERLIFNGIEFALSSSRSYSLIKEKSFQEFYNKEIISKVGFEIEDTRNKFNHVNINLEVLDKKIKEFSAVNIDEELINLTKLQKAYEAAAKVITITDELMETLLKMV